MAAMISDITMVFGLDCGGRFDVLTGKNIRGAYVEGRVPIYPVGGRHAARSAIRA